MKKVLSSIAFLLIAAGISRAQEVTTPAPVNNPNAAEITFTEDVFDFGTLKQGADCMHDFVYHNTGKEPLIISNCQQSCGCTTPLCPKDPVKPGMTGIVKVKYDSNRVGPFTKTVTITSNAKNSPKVITIKGMIEAAPKEEMFGTENVKGAPIAH